MHRGYLRDFLQYAAAALDHDFLAITHWTYALSWSLLYGRAVLTIGSSVSSLTATDSWAHPLRSL